MVTPPALRAATEALLQLQTNKSGHVDPKPRQASFSTELAKQLGQQTTHAQNHTLINSLGRPVVYIPLATEAGISGPTNPTTQRREKKARNAKAAASYRSAPAPLSK